MHLAVKSGNLEIFKWIFDNTEDKNTHDFHRITPMHPSAHSDNLEILQLIFNHIEDKQPKNFAVYTVIHLFILLLKEGT